MQGLRKFSDGDRFVNVSNLLTGTVNRLIYNSINREWEYYVTWDHTKGEHAYFQRDVESIWELHGPKQHAAMPHFMPPHELNDIVVHKASLNGSRDEYIITCFEQTMNPPEVYVTLRERGVSSLPKERRLTRIQFETNFTNETLVMRQGVSGQAISVASNVGIGDRVKDVSTGREFTINKIEKKPSSYGPFDVYHLEDSGITYIVDEADMFSGKFQLIIKVYNISRQSSNPCNEIALPGVQFSPVTMTPTCHHVWRPSSSEPGKTKWCSICDARE